MIKSHELTDERNSPTAEMIKLEYNKKPLDNFPTEHSR